MTAPVLPWRLPRYSLPWPADSLPVESPDEMNPNKAKNAHFTGTREFYEDDGEPKLYLMAYCGQADLLLETFAAGYKVHDGLLHDACCGRPTFRGYAHDGHYPHWPEGFRETVRVLIAHGANVNARNQSGNAKYEGCEPWVCNGETPLHFAAGAWDQDILRQLLHAGADPKTKNDLGETPHDWAIRYGAPPGTVDLLKITQ